MNAAQSRATLTIARAAAFGAGALGVLVLTGYALHIGSLVRFLPDLPGMSPVTAVGLLLLSTAELADSWGMHRLARGAALTAVSLGLGMLALRFIAGDDVFSPAVSRNLFQAFDGYAGKTSPATAASLVALGSAALCRARPFLADGMASTALVISGLAAIGYAYDVTSFYAIPEFDTMAPHTAAALLLLSISSLCVRGHGGWLGIIYAGGAVGRATRRQLAVTASLPGVGWVMLERMNEHQMRPAMAVAVMVIVTMTPLTLLILRDGHVLATLDWERHVKATMTAALTRDMEQRLAQQATELTFESAERAKAEATVARAQRMEAIGHLTGGIAHDFNNLLTVIKGSLQLLDLQLPHDHPGRRSLDMATAATDKGAAVTRQFLTFSRSQTLDVRPVELDPVLNHVRGLLGNALGPSIGITFRLNAAAAWAMTDPDQLELAILNLTVNARDAMPEGGELIVQSQHRRTRLEGENVAANYLSITVTDTGHGMEDDVAARAMEPFFTTKERGKGTGLGLAQVFGFTHQCQGGLRINSSPGHGTTVEILLPLADPPHGVTAFAAPAHDAAELAVAAGDRTILVIDDEADVREVVGAALRRIGYKVVEARDGRDGLERLQTLHPAAAVIDFIMPGLNGAEVARRARQRHPEMPIIFMSGYFDTVALDGIAHSVLLRKPFDLSGLQRTLSSIMT